MKDRLEKFNAMLQEQLANEESKRLKLETSYNKESAFSPSNNPDLVSLQLDLEKEKDRLYHLISGHVFKKIDGSEVWAEPDDDRLKIFSEYGVNQIMTLISFYLSPNTLLSCFDKETIMATVLDFGIELSDLVFVRYEAFFHYPTPEDLFDKYWPMVKKDGKITDQQLYFKCVQWSDEELSNKFRHYSSICLAIVHAVHATYLRALNGEERETLRKFIHVSQSTTTAGVQQPPKKGFNLFKQ